MLFSKNNSQTARATVSPDHESSQILATFVSDLLKLIQSVASQVEVKRGNEYCEKINRAVEVISNEKDAFALEIARDNCVRASEEFFRTWRFYIRDRENEFRELVDVLLDAVKTISSDNQDFQETLHSSNERLSECCDIEDIRDLKTRLKKEVDHLGETIRNKQQNDELLASTLSKHIHTLQEKLQEAEQKALTDGLSGLFNRASFDRKIRELVVASQSFVLAIFDIDDFKQINDRYGHQTGDMVIQSTARAFREATRSNDFVARYGGEEFVIIHVGSRNEHSFPRFVKMLSRIAASSLSFNHYGVDRIIMYTISGGMTEFVAGDNVETLIARADEALYQSKSEGKNRITVHTQG